MIIRNLLYRHIFRSGVGGKYPNMSGLRTNYVCFSSMPVYQAVSRCCSLVGKGSVYFFPTYKQRKKFYNRNHCFTECGIIKLTDVRPKIDRLFGYNSPPDNSIVAQLFLDVCNQDMSAYCILLDVLEDQ